MEGSELWAWEGRYAVVGSVKPKDEVTLTFPIQERTDVVRIEGDEYTLVRKGNEVVKIDPPGENFPSYRRDHYRQGSARFKTVKRFVSDVLIVW